MHVEVSHYRLGKGTVAELQQRVEVGPAKIMAEVRGFIDYYAFDAGDGHVVSVSVFRDAEGTAEAEARLEGWIMETMEAFEIEPIEALNGLAFASAKGEAR